MAIVRRKPKKDILRSKVRGEHARSPAALLELAKRAQIETTPLDIKGLIRAVGLRVKREPLADDISGMLDHNGEDWEITVNSLHHPRRQRFTLAHELAHYVLHSKSRESFVDKTLFRSTETGGMEAEANRFAAGLLMPESEFRRFVADRSSKVEDLARHFEVSALAVRVRAKELGFTGHGL